MPVSLLLAEVADKEGPLWIPWVYTGILAVVAYAVVRWRPQALWGMFPLTAAWAWMLVEMATESGLLPRLLEELGLGYVISRIVPAPLALLAAVVPVVRADLPLVRAWWEARSRHRSRASDVAEPYRHGSSAAPSEAFPLRLLVVVVGGAAVLVVLVALSITRIAAARGGHAP